MSLIKYWLIQFQLKFMYGRINETFNRISREDPP